MHRTRQVPESTQQPEPAPLGAALRRGWIGYQKLLEGEMRRAGTARREFPDGRVLHICKRSPETTISEIGRELGITRQGASKIVGVLRDQGFVTLQASQADGREKLVKLTDTAETYLEGQRKAARRIERRLKSEFGDEAFTTLYSLLDYLGTNDPPRLRAFLRERSRALRSE